MRRKAYRKRTSGRVRLVLGSGLELAVALYTLLHAAAKGATVLLHAESNEELRSENALICMDTGALAGHRRPWGQRPVGGKRGSRCTRCCTRPPRARPCCCTRSPTRSCAPRTRSSAWTPVRWLVTDAHGDKGPGGGRGGRAVHAAARGRQRRDRAAARGVQRGAARRERAHLHDHRCAGRSRAPAGTGARGSGGEWQWRCTCCCMRPPRA